MHEIAECDQLPRHQHVGIDVDGRMPHRITDPLDAQRRRRLGVPVVEEVPNRQVGCAPSIRIQLPSCSSADNTTSKLPSRR